MTLLSPFPDTVTIPRLEHFDALEQGVFGFERVEDQQIKDEHNKFVGLMEVQPGAETTLDVLIQVEQLIRRKLLSAGLRLAVSLHAIDFPNSLEHGDDDVSLLRNTTEGDVLEIALGTRTDIRTLLNTLEDKLKGLSSERDIHEYLSSLNIFHKPVNNVVLPPDDISVQRGSGNGFERDTEGYHKLAELIDLLREYEVYTDDILVISGVLHKNQMRQESYMYIEIPRLNRSVLLCNAYGEASFVLQGIMNRADVFVLTKKELQEKYGEKLIKICFNMNALWKWRSDMAEALFFTKIIRPADEDEENGTGNDGTDPDPQPPVPSIEVNPVEKKVDIRDREFYKEAILDIHSTAGEFMGMIAKVKKSFKVAGKGLTYIANTVFGLEGKNPINYDKDMATLARLIYGEGHECIDRVIQDAERVENMKPADYIEEIKKDYPNAKEFMGMNAKEKRVFYVAGKGLVYIANTVFRLEGRNPIGFDKDMAELARLIYGEGHECIECFFWTTEEWKNKITEKFPTAEEFMGMKQKDKKDFKVAGKGLTYIANTVFGLEGRNPIGYDKDMAELARLIYGEGYECIDNVLQDAERVENMKPADYIEEIKKDYPTAEEFMGMKQKDKKDFKVAGKGLTYIANTVFGLEGKNPCNSDKDIATLAREIYGEGYECIECFFWTIEEWKNKITEKFPTAGEFMEMKKKDKKDFKVAEKGLVYIANRVFGLEGRDPKHRKADHIELARIIYGDVAVDAVLSSGVSLE